MSSLQIFLACSLQVGRLLNLMNHQSGILAQLLLSPLSFPDTFRATKKTQYVFENLRCMVLAEKIQCSSSSPFGAIHTEYLEFTMELWRSEVSVSICCEGNYSNSIRIVVWLLAFLISISIIIELSLFFSKNIFDDLLFLLGFS